MGHGVKTVTKVPKPNPGRPRTGARVAAVQALFQAEQSGDPIEAVLEQFVRHRLGVTTWYAHLATLDVRPGQCLTAGDRVGTVGATGRASGPHLHFEIRVRDAVVDPRSGGLG